MNGFVSSAGQTGKSLVDLDVRIADLEVGVVVISGQPAGRRVGDLVGLGSEVFTLNKAVAAGALDRGRLEYILTMESNQRSPA
jgi:hypothetical protein